MRSHTLTWTKRLPNTESGSILNKQLLGGLILAGCGMGLLAANPMLTCYALAALFLIIRMVWIPGQPTVFLYAMLYQWAQSSMRLFQANVAGKALNDFDASPSAEMAVFTALTCVFILSWILATAIRQTPFDQKRIKAALATISVKKAFVAYVLFILAMPLIRPFKTGGLAQIIFSFESFRWLAFAILTLAAFQQKRYRGLFLLAFAFEFITGLTGFFSSFKSAIIYSALLLLTFVQRLILKNVLSGLGFTGLLLGLGLFWSAIKVDYRSYLSGGQRSQYIVVSEADRIAYLVNVYQHIHLVDWNQALQIMLERVQYTQMIQKVMDNVPKNVVHEQGKMWQDAILHVLMPRILFPDKAPIDDSLNANKYSGEQWATASEGTSISIGYIAESYVDFGLPWLFVPIIFLGLLMGWLYRYFARKATKAYPVLYFAGTFVLFFQFSLIEMSLSKLLGGMLMTFLVYVFIIQRFVFPRYWKFITN